MRESVIYQDIFAAGEARGLAKGEARGEARGLAKGEARGLAKGEAKALVRVLEARFGRLPDELRERLRSESSLERLDGWLDRALSAASLEEFCAAL